MTIPAYEQKEGSVWEPDSGIQADITDGGDVKARRMYDVDSWSGKMVYSLTAAEMRNLQSVFDADPEATHGTFKFDGDYNSPQAQYKVTIVNRPHGELVAGEYIVELNLIGVVE